MAKQEEEKLMTDKTATSLSQDYKEAIVQELNAFLKLLDWVLDRVLENWLVERFLVLSLTAVLLIASGGPPFAMANLFADKIWLSFPTLWVSLQAIYILTVVYPVGQICEKRIRNS